MSKLEGWGTEKDAEAIKDSPFFQGWTLTTFKKMQNGRVHWVLTSPKEPRAAQPLTREDKEAVTREGAGEKA